MHEPSGFTKETSHQRGADRNSMMLAATLTRDSSGEELQLRVRNISPGGLMADVSGAIAKDERVRVELRGVGPVSGKIAWARNGQIGIQFDGEINPMLTRRPVGNGVAYRLPIATEIKRPSFKIV